MSVFLKNVSELLKGEDINEQQALYLIFLKDEIQYEIDEKDLLELVVNKLVLNNAVAKSLLSRSKSSKKGVLEPKFEFELSKEVYEMLCRKVCNKNFKTGFLQLPEGETDLTYTSEEYLNGEEELAPMFWTLLFLFPSKGEPNKRWEKLFIGDFYDGIPLRNRSKDAGRLFVTAARKYDMGALLLGTYRYIKDNVKEKKAYITTIPKYLKMHSEYTRQAALDIQKAKKVEELFKEPGKSAGVKNVIL